MSAVFIFLVSVLLHANISTEHNVQARLIGISLVLEVLTKS